jgi:ribosome biogenesis GTPase / thiamine phosphate phosphatase
MQNTDDQQQSGLVISYFGNSVAVEVAGGQVVQCHLHRNQELPVVGDRVHWQFENSETGSVIEILPRKSVLARGDRGKRKPIAANIDLMAVVMAPPPIFSTYLVDRYLVAAELLQIAPLIVVNKSDLLTSTSQQVLDEALVPYQQVPYPIILSSVYKDTGLAELSAFLANKTAVLVGPSGVGKSSIISALAESDIRTSHVSPKGAGKHTTTATRLYHLPRGGNLIDSPGVREFHLWQIEKPEVLHAFRDFNEYAPDCRFRDCQHLAEPGCAVQKAVADGRIASQRYASYQALMATAVPAPIVKKDKKK